MWYKLPSRVWRYFRRNCYRRKLRQLGVEFGMNLHLSGMPIVSLVDRSYIKIGERVVLTSESKYTALGVNHPVILRTLNPGASIIIGNHVGISGGTICAAQRVILGNYTMLGANVTIADTNFHPLSVSNRRYTNENSVVDAKEIIIGNNVFIGTNSIVLKGVQIGDNAVIGAGSVVTQDIPTNAIAAGNPCRVIRYLNDT